MEQRWADAYDEKVLEEATFYGLPMYQLANLNGLGPAEDSFPSVDFDIPLSRGSIVSVPVTLQLRDALDASDVMSQVVTDDGVYYMLDGHVQGLSGIPIQPRFYATVPESTRGVVLLEGSYESLDGFDPVLFSPANQYYTETVEGIFRETGWVPPLPVGLRTGGEQTNLVIEMGQYSAQGVLERLYRQFELALYYDDGPGGDDTPPQIALVDGLYNYVTDEVHVKVGAMDPSGIRQVLATYTQGNGRWESVDLSFDDAVHKWTGYFPGDLETRFFIQVVDEAGNVAYAVEDGRYFAPALDPNTRFYLYLPFITRWN
jgi:hypothetical protein